MYGYRPSEVGVVLGPNERPDLSFRVIRLHEGFFDMDKRRSVRVSLGCHIRGASLPVPDLNHGPSLLAGCTKRVAAAMPRITQPRLRSFHRFVKKFCNKYLTSLRFSPDETFEFENWIDETNYALYRREELKRVHELGKHSKVNASIKAFAKDENYTDFKHLRGIYSRHDDYKCRVGPFFQKFGDRLFALPWFIKKIPVPDRPHALLERLSAYDKIFCTDFSQYEATFIRDLMRIEHWVYRWCLEGHPMQQKFMELFTHMSGTNKIQFRDFCIKLIAKRMSGEMNTSCGNGLMNLLITMYNLYRIGNDLEKVHAYFEGDDGIIGCSILPTANLYSDLGATIKIEIPESIATASFCGNVFDPVALHNVTNPMEASVAFGWIGARSYRFSGTVQHGKLLCCKSLSMLYSYPGCPILAALGRYGLRVSGHHIKDLGDEWLKSHSDNLYEYELNRQSLDYISAFGVPTCDVHINTRLLVEKLYHISVESQIFHEKYLDSLTGLQELVFDLPFPRVWLYNDSEYCLNVDRKGRDPFFTKIGFVTPAYTEPGVVNYFKH
jgi:hypothetical protein